MNLASRKIPYRRAFTFPTPTHLHSLRHATNSRAKWHKVISARLFFFFFFVSLLRPLPLYPSSPPMHLTASTRTSAEPPFVDGCHVPMPLPSTGRELPSPNPSLVSQRDKDGKPPGREPSRQIPISEGLLFLGILFMLL